MPLYVPQVDSFVLNAIVSGGHSPADATQYYWGAFQGFAPATSATLVISVPVMPRPGVVRRVYGAFVTLGTLASAETFSIYVYNTTSLGVGLITSSAQMNAVTKTFNNPAMSLAFNAGEALAVTMITPTWATNPTAVLYNVTAEVEYY